MGRSETRRLFGASCIWISRRICSSRICFPILGPFGTSEWSVFAVELDVGGVEALSWDAVPMTSCSLGAQRAEDFGSHMGR